MIFLLRTLGGLIDDTASDDFAGDATHPAIGVDAEEQDLEADEGAPTYPVSEEERLGVDTELGTDPQSMDQADEQNDAKIWGTPDDPMPDSEYPPRDEDENVPIV